jgi:hypothetical protein
MPVETIKCRECGSADVTEFKAGGYVCGHCEAVFKHVDPSGTSSCSCGTFAIGRCAECHTPVCAHHSEMFDGQRLCIEHAEEHHSVERVAAAQRRREIEQADHARREQERRDWLEARQGWLERCHKLLAEIDDPVARHVVAVREATSVSSSGPLLEALLPERTDAALWDDEDIKAWFLWSGKRSPPVKLRYSYRTCLSLEGFRECLGDGWWFSGGSTQTENVEGAISHLGIGISVEGRWLCATTKGCIDRLDRLPADNGLNAHAVCLMADMVDLPRLPSPPPAHYADPS